MRVYFFRHGQTEGNRDRKIQGHSDVKLSEKGIAQAERLKKSIEGIEFDRKIASDLYRTRQTAAIVFGENAVEYDERVRELNNTPLAGRGIDELTELYGERFIYALYKLDYSYFGCESAESLVARAKSFLDDLARDTESENVAVVTHGGFIHAVLANVLEYSADKIDMRRLYIGNCTANIFEYADGKWKLIRLNNKYEMD